MTVDPYSKKYGSDTSVGSIGIISPFLVGIRALGLIVPSGLTSTLLAPSSLIISELSGTNCTSKTPVKFTTTGASRSTSGPTTSSPSGAVTGKVETGELAASAFFLLSS